MRTIKPATRRRPVWQMGLLVLLVLVVGGAATFAGLIALRVVDPARLAFWRGSARLSGRLGHLPGCRRPISAFRTVTQQDLIDPKTGQLATKTLPPSVVPKSVIRNFAMVGRVIGREHHAGYAFSEDELLPPGTHPGVAGGTPLGKRAFTLDASKLKGIHDLEEGDHLDLLASIPIDMPGTAVPAAGRGGTTVLVSPDNSLLPKRSVVRPLVQDGVVVTPVRVRNAPMSAGGLMQGTFDADRAGARGDHRRRSRGGGAAGGGAGLEIRDHLCGAERPGRAAAPARRPCGTSQDPAANRG